MKPATIGALGTILAALAISPVVSAALDGAALAQASTPFDQCMDRYGAFPDEGPWGAFGFIGSQMACHAYVDATSAERGNAALCVAESVKTLRSSRDFDLVVATCYHGMPISSRMAYGSCLMKIYDQIDARAKAAKATGARVSQQEIDQIMKVGIGECRSRFGV